MSTINGVNYNNSVLTQSVLNIKTQLGQLQNELASGEKSTTYSGMGSQEGLAIAARAQISNISAFTDTITNVTTTINAATTALQSVSKISSDVENQVAQGPATLNSNGQTSAQQAAVAQLSSLVGILNSQSGNNFLFSGSATNTASVASATAILNGSGTQAGLTQLISQRNQADGTSGLGRLAITQPTATSVSVAEDAAGSVFGMKLSSVTSTLTGATVTGPTGSPAAISVALGATNPNNGDKLNLTFNLPDGTTTSVQLTATTTTPAPSGSFTIGATPTATATNLNAALTKAIGTTANTALLAASDVAAANNFFGEPPQRVSTNPTFTGTPASNNNTTPAPISGATLLSGASSGTSDSLSSGFSAGDTVTVNGQTLTFVASGASGANQVNVTDNVGTLLSKIDALSGATTPSSVSAGGAITLQNGSAANLSVTSNDSAALAALGLGGNIYTATSLVAGTPTNTVSWYTGATASGSARASLTARVDTGETVQYGIQANETAISSIIKNVALLAAVTTSSTNPNATNQVSELNQRVTANLSSSPGQQSITDIESDLSNAQITMKDASSRQSQQQTALQNLVTTTETVSSDQVASEILALQTSLQASYQTTSMLSQLTLTKYLPVG
ncbi:MAG: flagellar protein [Xanthobacteraceae bacterium]|nr:flagellar protein [Xanthobacteraceae bacterium]